MGLYGKIASLFGKNRLVPPASHQVLTVVVQISQNSDEPMADFVELEDRIIKRVEEVSYGEFEGIVVSVDGSHTGIYINTPNADDMLSTVAPLM